MKWKFGVFTGSAPFSERVADGEKRGNVIGFGYGFFGIKLHQTCRLAGLAVDQDRSTNIEKDRSFDTPESLKFGRNVSFDSP